ncbi:type IV pilus assembly protein PilW [Collimonas sp. PA-H2]|uniref:PilW family protein n=1 Tax=Collimonas sp. PA-H2 TaxID=1881062 RepID=UPI000BF6F65C|nr:PilW family protein [Collimonas sp. PA-H2]PFH08816.1 type IV pilus assembly protein PilW [Collimonas sp. PA-H2]
MMNLRSPTLRQNRRMQGFTLVELMVSVTIGLILVMFLSSLYLNSKSSSRLNDDNARIQEDGRYALSVIGRSLMQAGFGNMLTGNTTDFPPSANPTLTGLMGCDKGFAQPITTTPPTCATTLTAPAFAVSYTSEPYDTVNTPSNSVISGAGTDCSGTQATGATSTAGGLVSNSFYLDTSKNVLYCKGNAGSTAQAILSNVDNMTITYGIDTGNQYTPMQSTTSASTAGASSINGNNKVGWDRVVTVTVCLEIHSTNNVITTSSGQTYYKCGATTATTASDHLLHTTMTRVFTLRNNAAASLVS